MNLLDTTVTPIWQAFEAVRELAGEDGIRVAESELIGLAPLAALLDVADHAKVQAELPIDLRLAGAAEAIKLRDFTPQMALEVRLAASEAAAERAAIEADRDRA